MMIFLLINILVLCSVAQTSYALPAMNHSSILSSSDQVTSTEIFGNMIYYGWFGIASTWSEAYGFVSGKQHSGWSFDTSDKIEVGTIMSFIGSSGTPTMITHEIPYFKLTVQVMQPRDGDYSPTHIHFMYVQMQDIGKIEASYNVKFLHACRYTILQGITVVEMWSDGTKTFSMDAKDLKVCKGDRPPKE